VYNVATRRRYPPCQRLAVAILSRISAARLRYSLAATAGCTEAAMLAHGFNRAQLAELVHLGFAAATKERVISGGQTLEVPRLKITEAGQRTLGDQR
jgi:hypothetical protein